MATAGPGRLADPTYYPIEEKVGVDSLQRFIAELFRGLLDHWFVKRGEPTFVGADQFIYWVQFRPQKVVAPDVYVLPGVPREGRVTCLKTWEAGVVPSFALELVFSNDFLEDYREAPDRYAELGVTELVIFDPDAHRGRDRLRFQVFRRVRGRFTRVAATNEDRIKSRVLGCWIRAVGKGDRVRLRLATGARGDTIFPTEAEEARARAEDAYAQVEDARARKDALTRAAQAEAGNARLRAEIERLRKK